MHQSRQVVRGAALLMAGRFAIAGVMALQALLIPRLLGPQSMGVYSYWVSIFLVFQAAFELGQQDVMARYLPDYWIRHREAVRPLFRLVIAVKLPIVLAVLLIGIAVTPDIRLHFAGIVLAAAVTSLGLALARVLYARGQMGFYALYPLARVGLRLVLILILFPLYGDSGTVLAFLAGSLLTAALFAPAAQRLLPAECGALPQPASFYLRFGLWTYFAGLTAMFTRWGPVLLCRHIGVPFASLGVLGLAMQLMLFSRNLLSCIADGTLPALVALRVTERRRFDNALAAGWRYTNVLLFPLAAAFVTLAEPAIVFLIGPEFRDSAMLLSALTPTIVFSGWAYPHAHLFLVHERKGALLAMHALGLGVFAACGLLWIPRWGIAGAVLALNTAMLVTFLYAFALTHRLQTIHGYGLALLRPAACAAAMGLVMHALAGPGPLRLALTGLAGAAVYGLLMAAVGGLTRRDLRHLSGILRPPTRPPA